MSRTETPPTQSEPAATSEQVRQALVGRHVCPYCGHQSAGPVEACPRCTMEDSPATRQATKARLGPWYVLQSRNPSAPGMKFATLLVLIRKGLITPRSVLRGPTTYQLWRFGAHVRGVSREFGLCYSCGSSILRTASFCPHCQRSQEPPAEPDVLLEQRPAASIQPAPAPAAAPETAMMPVRASRPRNPVPVQQEASMTTALTRGWNPPVRRGGSSVVSAMDLAAALRGEVPDTVLVPSRRKLKLAIALLIIVSASTAALFYLRPDYQQQTFAWVQQTWTIIQTKASQIDWPTVSTTPIPQSPANVAIVPTPRYVPTVAPVTAPQDEPVEQPQHPAVADAKSDPNASIEQARTLWSQAIDAEGRQDFVEAIRLYEQIHQLPNTAWPGGLQINLDLARKRMQASSAQ